MDFDKWVYKYHPKASEDLKEQLRTAYIAGKQGIDRYSAKEALEVLKQVMIDDEPEKPGSYAHSWHCTISMACQDAIKSAPFGDSIDHDWLHRVGNDAASRFMKMCFGVTTKA